MSIRFPKRCKTKAQRSAHARHVANVRWDRHRDGKPSPVWIGGIVFDGPLAANSPMRLDIYAVDGERKWTGISDGRLLSDRMSERGVLRMVRTVLRAPRTIYPITAYPTESPRSKRCS